MSNGYDFFGGAGGRPAGPPGAAVPRPHDDLTQRPAVDRWGLPIAGPAPVADAAPAGTPGYSQYAPAATGYPPPPMGYAPPTGWSPSVAGPAMQSAARTKTPGFAIAALVAVVAVVAGAFLYLDRAHPVPLPDSAGGLTAVTQLPASTRSDINDMKKGLAKSHLHDISTRLYGSADGSGPGLLVVAGRIAGADANMAQLSSQVAAAAAGASARLSSGQLTSGTADFECLWENQANEPMSVCFWWSQHSLLMGVGIRMDAQTTADALAEAKGYASLS